MLRLFAFSFLILLFFNTLNAQGSTKPLSRPTTQDLSPAQAEIQKQTSEVAGFAQALEALKTVFAEKDASRIVAYEAYILRVMQIEAEQMALKAVTVSAPEHRKTQRRLDLMNQTLRDFEAHAFDPGKPEAAARDFAKLDTFLKIMQEELKETNQ